MTDMLDCLTCDDVGHARLLDDTRLTCGHACVMGKYVDGLLFPLHMPSNVKIWGARMGDKRSHHVFKTKKVQPKTNLYQQN
eukprot:scaffold23487_cov104-Cylindrotheca_fusiformis.AAC.2